MGRLTDSPRWMLKELLEACTCRICVICSYVRCKVVVNGICEGVGCRVGGSRDKTEGRRWSWLKGAYTDARSRLVQYTISRDRGVLPKLKRWTFFRSLRSFRRHFNRNNMSRIYTFRARTCMSTVDNMQYGHHLGLSEFPGSWSDSEARYPFHIRRIFHR